MTIHLRKKSSRNYRQVIKERAVKLICVVESTNRSKITPLEMKFMEDFVKTEESRFSSEGVNLNNRIALALTFYKSLATSTEVGFILTSSGYIPEVDTFLDNFIKHYTTNTEFRDSLVVHLTRGYVSKVEGVKNPKYGSKVLNFMLALAASGNKKAFEYGSGNLCSVS